MKNMKMLPEEEDYVVVKSTWQNKNYSTNYRIRGEEITNMKSCEKLARMKDNKTFLFE